MGLDPFKSLCFLHVTVLPMKDALIFWKVILSGEVKGKLGNNVAKPVLAYRREQNRRIFKGIFHSLFGFVECLMMA